ncbi:hypothetical protein [Butyrivibrio proteoclasticus]|uniref:hypothetical protein n=1 Tax=Butyrivibrio proteoclasticus TaxID=43305 RepID=UPI00047D9841|nr:hypothetical protein [Butyrivibrio proteoclasticus]
MSDFFSGMTKVDLGNKKKVNENETKERKEVTEKKANSTSTRAKTEKRELKTNEVVLENPAEALVVEEEKQKETKRGRRPTGEEPMERRFIAVNIGNGVENDLGFLIKKYERETGKKNVGVGTYIRYLVDKDIEENRDYIEKAKKYEELLFGD